MSKREFENGKISAYELKAVENEIMKDINKQKELGYHVITDQRKFRRATWRFVYVGFDGVAHEKTKTGLPFHGEDLIDDTCLLRKSGTFKVHPS